MELYAYVSKMLGEKEGTRKMTAESYTSHSRPIWISHEIMDRITKMWQDDDRIITFADYMEEILFEGIRKKELEK